MSILSNRVHGIDMEFLNDGVDKRDEPSLDDGYDIVEEEGDDVAWIYHKYSEDIDPSSLR